MGDPTVRIGLIDGPIATEHPDLSEARILSLDDSPPTNGAMPRDHGTFIAGMLCASRESSAPAICPGCTILHASIFTDPGSLAGATPQALADAVVRCVDAGAEVVNLSVATAAASSAEQRDLRAALDHAMRRRVVVVGAAGNEGTVAGSTITRHPGVVPVTACDRHGRPLAASNLGHAIGRRGLGAPGDAITSLAPAHGTRTWSGTSVAVPFVTGTLALLRSIFPTVPAIRARLALARSAPSRRRSITPALLNAEAAYRLLQLEHRR